MKEETYWIEFVYTNGTRERRTGLSLNRLKPLINAPCNHNIRHINYGRE